MLGWPSKMEFWMRLTPVALTLAIAIGTMASAGFGQRPDDVIDQRSLALVQEAQTQSAASRYDAAIDLLETALAIDPRNRGAYVALGRIAQAQRLPGKAIGHYADALRIEPNDQTALAAQGEAYVQRGAVERARANLTRLRTLCGNSCASADQLAAAITRGPPAAEVARVEPPAPTPAQPRRN
jgi:tetratricopeptide (TPR) repeat protein